MQTRKDDNTFPFQFDGQDEDGTILFETGLTKREYFAAAALQGLLTNPDITLGGAAKEAVRQADSLIRILNETNANGA